MVLTSNKFTTFLLSYHPGTVKDLPVVSPYAIRLLSEEAGREPDKDELVRAFETDPFLSAKVCGVANSMFFNQHDHTIFDVGKAIDRVGLEYATKLLRQAPCFPPSCDLKQLEALWVHSIAVASAARALGEYVRSSYLDMDMRALYLMALIHDIGYFVEIHYDVTRLSSIAGSLPDEEIGSDPQSHVVLGEALAHFWTLPAAARDAIRWHHSPNGCQSQKGQFVAAVIKAAETIVVCWQTKRSLDLQSCEEAMAITGLTDSHMKTVVATMDKLQDGWTRGNIQWN